MPRPPSELNAAAPVHIAVAEPWKEAIRRNNSDADSVKWHFPDGVRSGDAVITIIYAREWTVTAVSVQWVPADGVAILQRVSPRIYEGMSLAALERRLGLELPRVPVTLKEPVGQKFLAAVDDELEHPTRWDQLSNPCGDSKLDRVVEEAHFWGCNACGRDEDDEFTPRMHGHVLSPDEHVDGWPSYVPGPVAVCPSCHDILHQPLGPTFDQLMFSNRPACPACSAKKTLVLVMGMPAGPPPHGTTLGGCVIDSPIMPGFVCDECGHRW